MMVLILLLKKNIRCVLFDSVNIIFCICSSVDIEDFAELDDSTSYQIHQHIILLNIWDQYIYIYH